MNDQKPYKYIIRAYLAKYEDFQVKSMIQQRLWSNTQAAAHVETYAPVSNNVLKKIARLETVYLSVAVFYG